jgi:8-oxo-dGTP pyrophosphatase MutT (NUDIX family)
MKQTNLCLLVKDDKILLAMKKRGFGVGKWNGTGGKLDMAKGDKSILDAAIRETKEEIGVEIKNPGKVGIFHFHFPYKPEWDQDTHVFLYNEWVGSPEESEEMTPKWFALNEIPYEQMWDDDKLWLPRILKGEKLEGDFIFEEGEKLLKHDIKVVESWI